MILVHCQRLHDNSLFQKYLAYLLLTKKKHKKFNQSVEIMKTNIAISNSFLYFIP